MTRKLSTVLAALAIVLGGAWMLSRGGSENTTLLGAALAQEADTSEVEIFDISEGNPEASVEVVEYASYTCGHCANFHAGPYKELKANYIDTGKIHFVYREIYFDRPGLWASMIGRCGGELRAVGFKDLIYSERSEWIGDGKLAGIADRLRKVGLAAGLTGEQIDACMADAATAQALVAWSDANSKAADVTGTPTFVINGKKYSNMPYDEFAAVLDGLLAE